MTNGLGANQKNKQVFFLVALPRSGNTLFASIMNQNPEIAATPNSITLEIMKDLFLLKQTDVFQNFPDEKSLNNVLDSVYDNYYKDWPQRIIIDRGPVMTPGNFGLMQKHYKRPFKVIVLLRDLMDVLASYMQWYTENPDAFPNRYNLKNDDEKLGMIMNKDGAVAKDLEAIKNAFNYPSICHFVKYNDIVTDPEKEFRKIYEFLEEPYFNHNFENPSQIEVNGIIL
jgi:sulfotransferase